MKKKLIFATLGTMLIMLSCISLTYFEISDAEEKTSKLTATVLAKNGKKLTVQDEKNVIYTFDIEEKTADVGSNIIIEYTGLLNKASKKQENKVISVEKTPVMKDENGIPTKWLDEGIFSNFYILANKKLQTLSLDEKIAQLLLVRVPEENAKDILKENQFGGYLFFERDFESKNENEVKSMISDFQSVSKIPILTAVDEEGGKVVRISSNARLREEPFKSSRQLYTQGGFDLIKTDTIEKSQFLTNLGLNLNLAPVVDVSTNSADYMYERTLGENSELTSQYAKTVIEAAKGSKVSYTLKHFPGYGNNDDTHQESVTDNRTYEEIRDIDLPPFKSGIEAGAEAVLVSHNIVNSIDSANPASLSPEIHNILRNDLSFTGIIMTDDLEMGALDSITDTAIKALLAGNDLLITTNYEDSIKSIKNAITTGDISEEFIDKLAFRILAWKYYKGLMFDIQK